MKSSTLPDLERSPGFVMGEITRLARREFDRRVRHFGLTRAQWLFLYNVGRRPDCTQADLAAAMQMEKITVGRQATRLLRAGWISRRDHAEDGRAYRLRLTPKASRMGAQLAAVATQLREDYLRGLPAARRTALLADLHHIKANLCRLEAGAKQSHSQS